MRRKHYLMLVHSCLLHRIPHSTTISAIGFESANSHNQAAVDWHHMAPISMICMTHCVYMQGSQTEAQFHSKYTMSLAHVGKFKLNCSINTHLPTHNSPDMSPHHSDKNE